jgi:hypothetical protein
MSTSGHGGYSDMDWPSMTAQERWKARAEIAEAEIVRLTQIVAEVAELAASPPPTSDALNQCQATLREARALLVEVCAYPHSNVVLMPLERPQAFVLVLGWLERTQAFLARAGEQK